MQASSHPKTPRSVRTRTRTPLYPGDLGRIPRPMLYRVEDREGAGPFAGGHVQRRPRGVSVWEHIVTHERQVAHWPTDERVHPLPDSDFTRPMAGAKYGCTTLEMLWCWFPAYACELLMLKGYILGVYDVKAETSNSGLQARALLGDPIERRSLAQDDAAVVHSMLAMLKSSEGAQRALDQ